MWAKLSWIIAWDVEAPESPVKIPVGILLEWKSILRILKYLKKISINSKENLDFSSRMWYNNVYRNEA